MDNTPEQCTGIGRRAFLGGAALVVGGAILGPTVGGRTSRAAADTTFGAPGGPWQWIALQSNMVMDDQMLRCLSDTSPHGIAFRAYLDQPTGADPRYSYTAIVSRFHTLNPSRPVYMYTQALKFTYNDNAQQDADKRIEQFVCEGYQDQTAHDWPLLTNQGATVWWANPIDGTFADWIKGRISEYVTETGTDGVICDGSNLRDGHVIAALAAQGFTLTQYQDAARAMFDAIRTELAPDKHVMFNGLWTDEVACNLFADQQTLIPHTDAAQAEYFGWDPSSRNRPVDVTQFFDVVADNPSYTIILNGRPRPAEKFRISCPTTPCDGIQDCKDTVYLKFAYQDFDDDYLWQRYCYAAYLMCAGPNTYFNYNAQFQEVTSIGRSGADAYYADWNLELGLPTEAYSIQSNGLYHRHFENGVVVMNPDGGAKKGYVPSRTVYDPEGIEHTDAIQMDPGTGQLLFYAPPTLPADLSIAFDNAQCPGSDWERATWVPASGGERSYLHLDADSDPNGFESEHDVLLEYTRRLGAATSIAVAYSTSDPNAEFMLVAEVDDAYILDDSITDPSVLRVRAEIRVTPTTEGVENSPVSAWPTPFRTPHSIVISRYPNRDRYRSNVPLVVNDASSPDDWHEITINANEIFGPVGRYTARRLAHLRVSGTVDVSNITLSQET